MTTMQNILAAEGGVARYSPLPMTLDASASASPGTAAGTVTASITTVAANTIICAVVFKDGGHTYTVSGVAAGALAMAQRLTSGSALYAGTDCLDYELWWVACPTPGTYSVVATISGPFDFPAMLVFSVTGVASKTAPWAPTVGSVNNQNGGAAAVPHQASFYTAPSANSFTFQAVAVLKSGTSNAPTVGTINGVAAALITGSVHTVGATPYDWFAVQYGVETSALSNVTVTYGGVSQYWITLTDALAG